MPPIITIEVEWDGVAEFAILRVNGFSLTGAPRDVQKVFDALSRLRSTTISISGRLRAMQAELSSLLERL